jgi:hypothetical protein
MLMTVSVLSVQSIKQNYMTNTMYKCWTKYNGNTCNHIIYFVIENADIIYQNVNSLKQK